VVYYFDRLTRRIFIEKMRKVTMSSQESTILTKLAMGLLLFCKVVAQSLLRQAKIGGEIPINKWRVYKQQGA
jgi:hypothetical protein